LPYPTTFFSVSHTIEGQRLEVNESLTRYQQELKSLAMFI
jgi:hypothetical protein